MQKNIASAFKARDWKELDNLFHQLKGSGGGAGFPQISKVATDILQSIRDKAYERLQSEIAKFDQCCNQIYVGMNISEEQADNQL